jgi:pimeloyl-ACP methyl ester carboxylesterase
MKGTWIRKSLGDTTVVFVHGILSSGEACWRNPNGAYWPELLKEEKRFEDLGIYVFTYSTDIFSGSYSIGDAVDSLREWTLVDHVLDTAKGVLFVCHSMGGIVVRRFMVKYQQILAERQHPVGLFLVASPSMGAAYANWLSMLAGVMGHSQAKALKFSQQNEWLNDLDRDFLNLKEAENPRFPIRGKELIEDKAIVLKKWFRKQVVEPFSGTRYFGEPYKVPESNHFSIAKPDSPEAIQHQLLCRFIEEMPRKKGASPGPTPIFQADSDFE